MSFKAEVQTTECGKDDWTANGLRFTEKEEAEKYANHLSIRWTLVVKTRVVESDDKVNAWFNGEVHLEMGGKPDGEEQGS